MTSRRSTADSTTEIERAKGEEAAIRRELAAGDAATLSSAKSYTDTSVAAEAEERTQGDATTLSSAKTYTDTSVADEAQKRGQGDAATLQSANEPRRCGRGFGEIRP